MDVVGVGMQRHGMSQEFSVIIVNKHPVTFLSAFWSKERRIIHVKLPPLF
jgi:hypothetical protein